MKRLTRIVLGIFLGAITVCLNVALWNIAQPGHSHGYAISGVMGRYGMTTADPLGILLFMSILVDAAFLITLFLLFPAVGSWLERKQDGIWPPQKEPRSGRSAAILRRSRPTPYALLARRQN